MNRIVMGFMALLIAGVIFVGTSVPQQEVTAGGYKVITLSESNTVSLNTPIDGPTATEVQAALVSKDHASYSKDPLYIVLNSPGGSVYAGNAIIETAKGLSRPVHTISMFSASMSFMISQYLDKRYVIETSNLMSHRAFAGGMSGQVPGNLITRTDALLEDIRKLEKPIADRAGYTLEAYEAMIADELWMNSDKSVKLRFADEVVRVRCDKTLNGPGEEKAIQVFIFTIMVTFHKCPLITYPLSVKFGTEVSEEWKNLILDMLQDRVKFVRNYGPILTR